MASVFALAMQAAVLAVLAFAAAIDVKRRALPNLTVLLVMAAGLALRITGDSGWPWASLALWLACIVGLGFIMAGRNWIGWGDAKMISAATLLVPPLEVADLLLAICVAGGVLACLYIATRHALLRGMLNPAGAPGGIWASESVRIRHGGPMPYGVAIFGGTAYALLLR